MKPPSGSEEMTLEEEVEILHLIDRLRAEPPGEDFAACVDELMESPIKYRRVLEMLELQANLCLAFAVRPW